MADDIVIYHNPECGTSRNTLAMIRNAGIEPHVIEYLKTPPSRALLVELIDRVGITPRDLLREKGTPYAELGLGDDALSDDTLVDAMMTHPVLINRPLVVSPLGVKLCRPVRSGPRSAARAATGGVCQGRRPTGRRRFGSAHRLMLLALAIVVVTIALVICSPRAWALAGAR